MGKWQAYVQTFCNVGGGVGFSARIPRDEQHFDTACIEGQLLLNRLLGSKTLRTVNDFVNAASSHAVDVVARTNARTLVVCFDDPRKVSKAKAATQQERDEIAQKSVESKAQKPYTEAECEAFFVRANANESGASASGIVRTPLAVHNALPVLDRLRSSEHRRGVMQRATQFVIDAIRAARFKHCNSDDDTAKTVRDCRGDVQIVFVANSVVEHGRLEALSSNGGGNDDDVEYAWRALDLDGTEAPATLAEAEELVSHYAMLPRTGKRVYVRCTDTDAVAILAHAVQREAILDASERKEAVWLDMNADGDLRKTFDEEEETNEQAAANADNDKKRKRAANNDYPRCVDMVRATYAFFDGAATHACFRLFTHPLHVLTYVAALGGSDNIAQLNLMTCDAWIKCLESDQDVALWLQSSVVCCEKPSAETLYAPLRSFVHESEMLLEFIALQFAKKVKGKKFEQISKKLNHAPRDEIEFAECFQKMVDDAEQARIQGLEEAKMLYEKKLADYEEEVRKEKERLAALGAAEVLPDGTIAVASSKEKLAGGAFKKPVMGTKRTFVPLSLDEVRARVRRAHWQMQKIINGTVAYGVRAFDEQRDGQSVWGWSENGEPTLNILPYAKNVQLFSQ